MSRATSVVRMLTRQWFPLVGLPAMNLAIAFVIIIAVGLAASAVGGSVEGMYEGMRWNGAIWAGIGPLMGLGVGAMSQHFPFALGLGLTRKEFLGGTAIVMASVAAVSAIVITILKAIEQATGGWGLSVRLFDTVWVSDGTVWQTLAQAFVVLLMGMAIGLALTALVARFGQTMLWVVLGALTSLGLLVMGLVLVAPAVRDWLWEAVSNATWGTWMLVLATVLVVSVVAWIALVRRAPVR